MGKRLEYVHAPNTEVRYINERRLVQLDYRVEDPSDQDVLLIEYDECVVVTGTRDELLNFARRIEASITLDGPEPVMEQQQMNEDELWHPTGPLTGDGYLDNEAPTVVRIYPIQYHRWELDALNYASGNYSEDVRTFRTVEQARAAVPQFLADNGFPADLPVRVQGEPEQTAGVGPYLVTDAAGGILARFTVEQERDEALLTGNYPDGALPAYEATP